MAAACVLLAAGVAHAQCVTAESVISSAGSFPSRVAGPIATNGTIAGLAKSDVTTATPAIFFATYNANLNPLTADRQIADASANGATALIWNGSEFALFYQTPGFIPAFQRIDASGNPIGGPIAIANHPSSSDDEFDVAWSPVRNAYGIARTVSLGVDRGLWLTVVSPQGAVLSDPLFSLFIATPVSPRVTALPDGSFAVAWMRTGSDIRSLALTIVTPTGAVLSNTVSERNVLGARLATDGNTILVIFSATTTTGSELRFAQFGLTANKIISDSPFITGSGSDVLPLQLQWNPTLGEWTLVYSDAAFGFNFPGATRLRHFASLTATPSDTLLSPDPIHSRLTAPYPIVFLGGGYIASIQRIISRQEGSESYLIKTCPFFVTASATPTVVRPFVPVTFTATPSGGTPGFEYQWQFGDNDVLKGQTVQHFYNLPGTYTVTLTGTDAAGAVSITHTTVVVGIGKQRAVRH
jgi:hypothetical protein